MTMRTPFSYSSKLLDETSVRVSNLGGFARMRTAGLRGRRARWRAAGAVPRETSRVPRARFDILRQPLDERIGVRQLMARSFLAVAFGRPNGRFITDALT